ncbi:MAG: site-specific integrase [Neomegalonema sp.]|nr:site-specific integrase [Neomegalonema sp.]
MKKHAAQNLRIKRKYLIWLRDAKGLSEASVEKASASIDRYEAYTAGANFNAYHPEKARGFKRHLEAARHERTGAPLSASTIDGILRDLKALFLWLADQPGYRSKITHADAAYFSATRKQARAAHESLWKPHPSPEQLRHVLRMMPAETVIERRDRAIVAFLFLTGSRDGAAVTRRLKHVDLVGRCVHFDGKSVATKFGKSFTTFFFPVGGAVLDIVSSWVEELKRDHLWGRDDPLFPRTKVALRGAGARPSLSLDRAPWASAHQLRKIFKEAFSAAGLPPHPPHRVRDTLAAMADQFCRTPEKYKAWSQNLGHESVLTTFTSYGSVAPGRQGEIFVELCERA